MTSTTIRIPGDLKEAFDRAFEGEGKDAIIAQSVREDLDYGKAFWDPRNWIWPAESVAIQRKALALSAQGFWPLALIALIIVAAPIWIFTEVPILDYPAHLARVTLLSNLPLDPVVARYWTADLRPLPNIGMDLFVPAVAPLIGPVAGLKLFATMGLALWIAGAGLLFRGLWGRLDAQPLLAAPFAFSMPFTSGFFNFHFGAGLALVGAGLWLSRRQHSFLFPGAMAGLALVLLFCHMMAVALLALFLGAIELGRLFAEGFTLARMLRAARDGLIIFLPSAFFWVLWVEHGDGGPILFNFLVNLKAPLTVSSALGGAAHNLPAILLIFSWLAAWRTGLLRIAQGGVTLLLATGLATLLMPSDALGGSGAHIRMGPVLMVVALAVLVVDWPRLIPLPKPWLIAGFYGLLAVGSLLTLAAWRNPAGVAAELRAMNAMHLPSGARLATAIAKENGLPSLWHVADLSVLDRKAFVPAFFTTRGQSAMRLNPAYAAIGAANAYDGGPISLSDVIILVSGGFDGLDEGSRLRLRPYRTLACDFDYLAVIGSPSQSLPSEFIPVAARPHGALYRIAPKPERHCPPR